MNIVHDGTLRGCITLLCLISGFDALGARSVSTTDMNLLKQASPDLLEAFNVVNETGKLCLSDIPGFSSIAGVSEIAEQVCITNVQVVSGIAFDIDKALFGPGGVVPGLNISIIGDMYLFGMDSTVSLSAIPNLNGKVSLVLTILFDKKLVLKDIFPEVAGTVLETLVFGNPMMRITTGFYSDPHRGWNITPGINFSGDLTLTGIFDPLVQHLDIQNTTVRVAGTMGMKLRDLKLTVGLGATFSFPGAYGSLLKSGKVALTVSGKPALVLAMTLSVALQGQDPITLVVSGDFQPKGITFAGTMDSDWHAPLGISWLTLEPAAVQLSLGWESPSLVTGFGLTAGYTLGTEPNAPHAEMALKWSATSLFDQLLYGELDAMTLASLLDVVGLHLAVPDVGLKKVEIYIVPGLLQVHTIGTRIFPPGVSFVFEMVLGEVRVAAQARVTCVPAPHVYIEYDNNALSLLTDSMRSTQDATNANYAVRGLMPRLLAFAPLSDIKNLGSSLVSEVSAGVHAAYTAALQDFKKAGSAALQLFLTCSITRFVIDLSAREQTVAVDVLLNGKAYSYSYSVDVLKSFHDLIASIATSVMRSLTSGVHQLHDIVSSVL